MHRILDNEEIKAMIKAFGCGFKDEFDISKLRYDRIICMTDADVDGSHIRILLLTFFFRFMRPLVEEGAFTSPNPRYIGDKRQGSKVFIQRRGGSKSTRPHLTARTTSFSATKAWAK